MSLETRDTVLSVIGLAVFLVLAYGVGILLSRFKNARFLKAWAPLQALIDGKVVNDGGGAATSWLTGTYRGYQVQARMSPQRNLGVAGRRFNDFAVALAQVKGEQDWTFARRPSSERAPEPGKSPWLVTADTTAVAQRLERAVIENMLPGLGYPKISFRQQSGLLEYQVDVTPALVPTPELFARTLQFLVWLEGVNREANPRS